MRNFDLLEHPLFIHRLQKCFAIPEFIALLEVPGVVENVGLSRFRILRQIPEHKFSIGGGQLVQGALLRGSFKPEGFVGVIGVVARPTSQTIGA